MIKEMAKMLIPSGHEATVMSVGGCVGGCLSYALGGFDDAIIWLLILVIVDYVTGTLASFKTSEWCSSSGFKGIFKKIFIFTMVALCQGIDQTTHIPFLRDVCIFAYAINEFGSILENIERMGYGHWLPSVVKQALKVLKDKEKTLLEEKIK